MPYYVYILASKPNGTLYIGSSTNLVNRVWQHKNKLLGGFTAKYNVNKLVYFEEHHNLCNMARREKRLKEWKRAFKIRLIEKQNPKWEDLYYTII